MSTPRFSLRPSVFSLHPRRMRWLVFALLAGLFVLAGVANLETVSKEAVVCDTVCRQLQANTTEGRQALIGSVWWAPLPFLLRLPFAAIVPASGIPWMSLLVSSLMGVLVIGTLEHILRRWGLAWARWPVVAALAAHPAFIRGCMNGSSETTVIYLVLLSAYGFCEWIRWREPRFIVYLGVGMALLSLMSMGMVLWLLVMVLLVLIDLLLFAASRSQRVGALILIFLPILYAVGLWVLMNWLIMGDGLYFLRSASLTRRADFSADPLSMARLDHGVAAAACALAIPLCALHHQRSGVFLGILGLSSISLALFLCSRGMAWAAEPAMASLIPITLLSVGYLVGLTEHRHHVWRAYSVLLAFVLLGAAFLDGAPREPLRAKYGAVTRDRLEFLPQIETTIRSRTPYGKVFVCGYEGFSLVDATRNPLFVNSMDLDISRMKRDYHGHDLFLLIHRAEDRAAMDSVHWKFPQAYEYGLPGMLYAGDWGDWRLYELIQVPYVR